MMMTTMTRFRFEGYAGEKKKGEERKGKEWKVKGKKRSERTKCKVTWTTTGPETTVTVKEEEEEKETCLKHSADFVSPPEIRQE